MKYLILILFVSSLISASTFGLTSKPKASLISGRELQSQVMIVDEAEAATCVGATPCRACKNCNYCKYCAKNGGKCGVCRNNRKKSHR